MPVTDREIVELFRGVRTPVDPVNFMRNIEVPEAGGLGGRGFQIPNEFLPLHIRRPWDVPSGPGPADRPGIRDYAQVTAGLRPPQFAPQPNPIRRAAGRLISERPPGQEAAFVEQLLNLIAGPREFRPEQAEGAAGLAGPALFRSRVPGSPGRLLGRLPKLLEEALGRVVTKDPPLKQTLFIGKSGARYGGRFAEVLGPPKGGSTAVSHAGITEEVFRDVARQAARLPERRMGRAAVANVLQPEGAAMVNDLVRQGQIIRVEPPARIAGRIMGFELGARPTAQQLSQMTTLTTSFQPRTVVIDLGRRGTVALHELPGRDSVVPHQIRRAIESMFRPRTPPGAFGPGTLGAARGGPLGPGARVSPDVGGLLDFLRRRGDIAGPPGLPRGEVTSPPRLVPSHLERSSPPTGVRALRGRKVSIMDPGKPEISLTEKVTERGFEPGRILRPARESGIREGFVLDVAFSPLREESEVYVYVPSIKERLWLPSRLVIGILE